MSDTETAEQGVITSGLVEEAMSYEEYRTLIDRLLDNGKTTGQRQSDSLTEYTRLNVQRMNRLDKRIELSASLRSVLDRFGRPVIWLVLTEGWCGDAAQNVPLIARMADRSDMIDLKLLLRDEHPSVMGEFLTDGSRSIPKLICLDAETLEVIGTWGPRPEPIQDKAMKWKSDPEIDKDEWAEKLHKWYAENRTEAQQQEFATLLEEWE